MAELTPEAKTLIRQHMLAVLVLPGIAVSLASAAAGYFIRDVAERAAYVESFKELSKPVLEAAQQVSAARATAEYLSKKVNDDAALIEQLRKRIEANTALAEADKTVSDIAKRLASESDFAARVARAATGAVRADLDSIKQTVANLGAMRGVTGQKINNPRMAGPDVADCPQGTFVSSIKASGAVGGNYATDGISELTVVCSPLR